MTKGELYALTRRIILSKSFHNNGSIKSNLSKPAESWDRIVSGRVNYIQLKD